MPLPWALSSANSWTQAYRGIIPHLHLETMIRRRGAADWWVGALRSGKSILILEVEGKVAGYATTGAARARGNYEGEIYELYLAPLYQGAGLGELLFEGCRHKLELAQIERLGRLGSQRQHAGHRLLLAPRWPPDCSLVRPNRWFQAGEDRFRLDLSGRPPEPPDIPTITSGSCRLRRLALDRLCSRRFAPAGRLRRVRSRSHRYWREHRQRRAGMCRGR